MIEVVYTDYFLRWLESLKDRKARQAIVSRLKRVAGRNLGDFASVGDGLSEFRIHYGPGYRLYYVKRGKAVVILLCGGDKGSQSRDIMRAKMLMQQLEDSEWP